MKIKPASSFKYNRPDEVAECWNGVTEAGLYGPLWNAMDDAKPLGELIDMEDSSPEDAIGLNSVASLWHKFTPEQQRKLNELAKRHKKEWDDL